MMDAMDGYAMVTQPMRSMNVKQVTTEIPPTFDGRASWFQYEEAIDEWCDVTKLEESKRGPALRNQLEGQASLYKHLLDREKLKDEETGVEYFKKVIREHFVKGANSVFFVALSADISSSPRSHGHVSMAHQNGGLEATC